MPTNYSSISVSLADRRDPPFTDPTGGEFPEWPGIGVEFVDTTVLQDAAGHYQFTFTDLPANVTEPRAVHMAFKNKDDTAWTRITQSGRDGVHTTPFWVTRWASDTPNQVHDLGINDVPVAGPHADGETYEVIVVIKYKKPMPDGTTTIHHTMIDPEIHNEPESN